MASTSGTKGVYGDPWPTKNVTSSNHMENKAFDSESVPSSLAEHIVPILRAANKIEKDNPSVSILCRLCAWKKAEELDPMSMSRGVCQFKTSLKCILERFGYYVEERTITSSDAGKLQSYYQTFHEQKVCNSEYTQKPEEMVGILRTATALYEVLEALIPQYIKRKIKAALASIRMSPSSNGSKMSSEGSKDIFDWLSYVFGFQKDNAANQREHLVLLLANIEMRNRSEDESQELIHENTVQRLMDKILENYRSWCEFLGCKSIIDPFPHDHKQQQLKLIYIALYLLIWGDVSNIRLMPECICYIFHHMSDNVYGILHGNVHLVTGDTYPRAELDGKTFLHEIITPIYKVLAEEAKRSNKGKESNSKWRNYDDLNEYFWWPPDPKANFFSGSDKADTQPTNEIVSTSRRRFAPNFQVMFRIIRALSLLSFLSVLTILFVIFGLSVSDLFAAILAFLPTGWALILVAQVWWRMSKQNQHEVWGLVKALARAYDYIMGSAIFIPIAILSWFPVISEFQTRLLFNRGFSRGLQISMILAGRKDTDKFA